ncbi:MAG TPA: hypothetical protein VMT62_03415 [Syntrophorhabdaceae bacterium]|nr:hypothetical protein [Syntrophorhabdaceae bacterium]
MKYNEAMQTIDTEKALTLLGLEFKRNGSYLNFPCIFCGKESSIRCYGDKKNVSYCPACKLGSNIIFIASKIKQIEFQDAKNLLLDKATYADKHIEQELNLTYTLEWCEEMAKQGLNQELCEEMGVGKPKGKTMLSGYIVFTVFNEQGLKVAYYGSKAPDKLGDKPSYEGIPKFHSSFNPESYLYGFNRIDPREEVWVTRDMFDCLRIIHSGKQSVCNFGLPYLSFNQYQLLSHCDRIVFEWPGDKREVAYSNIALLKTFYRFA